mmetsp:Transcript_4371/g.7441  ORF Transcript_4371/g.7441 Transcript_4371/m.7441 type:complete len:271 (-) Transcript_4371:1251-2063(-)
MDLLGDDDKHILKYKDEIRAVFNSVDVDGSGIMEKEEFIEALTTNKKVREMVKKSRLLSGMVASNDFDAAFSSFDSDNGGSVSFEEFWTFCKSEADEENIRRMFLAIDIDGSRYITKEELVHAFKHSKELLGLVKKSKVFGKLVEENDWEKVIAEMDTDRSGDGENKIDYPEFWKWCKMIAARVQISVMKENARARMDKIQAEKKIKSDALMKRLRVHTFQNGAGLGGVFSVSIVPEPFNFEHLAEAPNPHTMSSGQGKGLRTSLRSAFV